MKYNELSVYEVADPITSRVRYFVVLDGLRSGNVLDQFALKASSERDGIYPIICCSCGDVGCGGTFVSTRIEGEDMLWTKFYWKCTSPLFERYYTHQEYSYDEDEIDPEDASDYLNLRKHFNNEEWLSYWVGPIRFKLSKYRQLIHQIFSPR